jgi:hypothetical protein
VSIAKNFLNEKELDGLNRIVTMYLDYAELQAQKGQPVKLRHQLKEEINPKRQIYH